MLGKTHIALGAASAIEALQIQPSLQGELPILVFIVISALSALIPDIDCPTSKLGRLIPFVSVPLNFGLGHRGATHSIPFAAILVFALTNLTISQIFFAPVLIGFFSHLVGDLFFGQHGLPLFWPIKERIILPVSFKVGGIVETLVLLGLIGFTMIYFATFVGAL